MPRRPVPLARLTFVVSLLIAASAAADPPRESCPRRSLLFADAFEANGPMPYALRSGVWYPAPPAAAETVTIARAGSGNALFFRGFAALRTDSAFPLAGGALRVAAHVDPVTDDVASLGWVSFVLGPDPDSGGWVSAPEALAALLVRSNGAIQVFSRGVFRDAQWESGPPAPAHGYDVSFAIGRVARAQRSAGIGRVARAQRSAELRTASAETRALTLHGSVGDARFHASLGDAVSLPAYVHLSLGAHFHEGDVPSSSVDDLRVEAVLDGPSSRVCDPR